MFLAYCSVQVTFFLTNNGTVDFKIFYTFLSMSVSEAIFKFQNFKSINIELFKKRRVFKNSRYLEQQI